MSKLTIKWFLAIVIGVSSVCFNSVSSASNRETNSVEKNTVNFIQTTVSKLHYSSYQLGGKQFDTARGIYILDCSNFVDHVLKSVSPRAYLTLVNATGADNPSSRHYYDFFKKLGNKPRHHWNKIDNITKLQPGDILVFRYKNARGVATGGHVMVVMQHPARNGNHYFVQVADSSPTAHSKDTRRSNASGVGIGTLLLKANTKTGSPLAYAWGVGGEWNRRVGIAMARPTDSA